MIAASMGKNGGTLAIFALIATGLLLFTQALTSERIAEQQRHELMQTLHILIPEQLYTNDLYQDCTLWTDERTLGSAEPQPIYRARQQGSPVALALRTTAPDGYSGDIHLLVAMHLDGTVLGVRVLEHKETPGLGDKIEPKRSDWIHAFEQQWVDGLDDPKWEVKRFGGQFDQFTGATITPRAIILAIQRTVAWANEHQDALFQAPSNCYSPIPSGYAS